MALSLNNNLKKQHWLYISEYSLTMIETGTADDGLPYFKINASEAVDSPINSAAPHAHWVSQYANGSVNILLAENLYQISLSDVPDVPDEELDAAIELKAADLIRHDLDDVLMDVIQLPSEAYRGRIKMAFIITSLKAPLASWMRALIQHGIKVDIVDISTTQLRNLSIHCQHYNETGVFHLQANKSRLILNYNKEMVLTRSFDVGLSRLLSQDVVQDDELEITTDDEAQTDIQIETLALEIRRSFDYYESQLGLGSIAEMQFLCQPEHHPIATKLAKILGIKFSIIRPEDLMHIEISDSNLTPVAYYDITGVNFRESLA